MTTASKSIDNFITLLNLLSDGQFHSGAVLAEKMQCTRSAICKMVHSLQEYAITIDRVQNRGYRLHKPIEFLDFTFIQEQCAKHNLPYKIDIRNTCTSTSTELVAIARKTTLPLTPCLLACEWQTAGKGRLGRSWISPIGHGLTFSVLWPFSRGLDIVAGLTPAIGVSVAETFQKFGIKNVHLKWPNDLITTQNGIDKKLVGILVEVQGDILGPCSAIIGIGINIFSAPQSTYENPVGFLEELTQRPLSRNKLLVRLLIDLTRALKQFEEEKFAPFQARWNKRAAWIGEPITAQLPNKQSVTGILKGIDTNGALLIRSTEGIQKIISAEKLRKQSFQ